MVMDQWMITQKPFLTFIPMLSETGSMVKIILAYC